MTVVEAAAEAPDESAVSEKNKPMRPATPQQSEKHRYLQDSGNVGRFHATLPWMARNRTAECVLGAASLLSLFLTCSE
ncbi:hypothetical protein [Streptomyces colonosanans]|uniref:hypothetical protein n=1 Tax=Streptomyces colonosanans TaxID=1428652 RepID=UPI0015A54E4E|nr:hypothetical protein [Streptomyces colonosanans]